MSSNFYSIGQRIPGGWCKKREIDLFIAGFHEGSSQCDFLSASLITMRDCAVTFFHVARCNTVRAYSRTLLGAIIAPNLVP